MAILKAEYGTSGTEWWLDVTHVRAALSWTVPREHLRDPYQSMPHADQSLALAVGDDPDILNGARVAMPNVIMGGCFHPCDGNDPDSGEVPALLLVVDSKNEPEPFGVIVAVGNWYLMNDNGDTIDRI